MRKTLIALLFAASLPAIALAMPEGGPCRDGMPGPGGHGKGAAMMFKDLDLTKEQHREFRKLMGEQMKSRHDITQRYLDKLPAADKKAMEDEIAAARKKNQDAMRALLKPEQQKAFDEGLKEMEARRAERAEFEAWKAERDAKKAQ